MDTLHPPLPSPPAQPPPPRSSFFGYAKKPYLRREKYHQYIFFIRSFFPIVTQQVLLFALFILLTPTCLPRASPSTQLVVEAGTRGTAWDRLWDIEEEDEYYLRVEEGGGGEVTRYPKVFIHVCSSGIHYFVLGICFG